VCANEAELALAENVPWSARDPATVASALIYATMAINKARARVLRGARACDLGVCVCVCVCVCAPLACAVAACVHALACKPRVLHPPPHTTRLVHPRARHTPPAYPQLKHPDTRDAVPSWEALSEVTGMAPATMRDCYRSMLPFLVVVSGESRRLLRLCDCPAVCSRG
jgi:hypothetical protein